MSPTRRRLYFGAPLTLALATALPLLVTTPLQSSCTSAPTSGSDGGDSVDASVGAEGVLAAAPLVAPELLGRPTQDSIAISVIPKEALEVYAEFGPAAGSYPQRTAAALHDASTPFVLAIEGLSPDTGYFYRLRWRRPGAAGWNWQEERTFHTQRRRGSTFRFTIQSGSNPSRACRCSLDTTESGRYFPVPTIRNPVRGLHLGRADERSLVIPPVSGCRPWRDWQRRPLDGRVPGRVI